MTSLVSETPTSATTSPTSSKPTPKPKPTPKTSTATAKGAGASSLESLGPVKGARAFATAYAKSINASDGAMALAKSQMTSYGQTRVAFYAQADVGLYYPGPIPLSPRKVQTSGSTSVITACVVLDGFATNRSTKKAARPRSVTSIAIHLRKSGSTWKVDRLVKGSGSCASVKVPTPTW